MEETAALILQAALEVTEVLAVTLIREQMPLITDTAARVATVAAVLAMCTAVMIHGLLVEDLAALEEKAAPGALSFIIKEDIMSIEERYKSQYFGSEMDERLGKAHHSGSSDPDSGTVGVLGQRYFNTATGDVFVCTAVSGSVYTWENKIGAVENIISSHTADTENPHAVTVDQMGGSNKNLLHNWYFPKPVNGRGQSSYSGNGSMTIDR